ncbi:2-dehydropantoate 2-reductase-like protein [Dendryphion nanum]|uniref:2-dehydropantoate 2-reductase n=1 Tax=Dendryphion nanum TaxID=256645 RepID=A0A9P9DNU4_9PLEO|nr:2-dehydropantoate 2-reductase-like protein [Dendryphion nanum]
MPPPSPSVHILGIGNLGKLLAHSLRKNHPELPITLLYHRLGFDSAWRAAGQEIEIVRNGEHDKRRGFVLKYTDPVGEGVDDKIENLIVTTKAHQTVQALMPLKKSLHKHSTILFCLNGMGAIDDVTSKLFPEPRFRPSYYAGIVNHGVYSNSTFSSVHAGLASAVFGPVSSVPSSSAQQSSNTSFLAQKLVECPELAASLISEKDILQEQLKKLVINAVINPLTAILDCINGDLFIHNNTRLFMDGLIAELSSVTLAILKSTYKSPDQALQDMFSPENLKKIVYDVGAQTAKNISSMRQDWIAGRPTEIDYINGYIVRQGSVLDIETPINQLIVSRVQSRINLPQDEILNLSRSYLS